MGLGLVLLPTLAVAVLARGVFEADRHARAEARASQHARLQARTSELASTLARHPDLFPAERAERFALGVDHPELTRNVQVDGSCAGWTFAEERGCDHLLRRFDRAELLDRDAGVYDARDFSFGFAAARQDAYLHLFARVMDDQLAPRGRRLDEGDHLRLVTAVPEPGGASIPRRFIVALGGNGDVTTTQVDRSWKREVPASRRVAWGQLRLEVYRRPYGKWHAIPDGYEIEIRLPLRTLGPAWREAEIGAAVVDVDVRPEFERGFSRQAIWIAPQREGAVAFEAPDAAGFRKKWKTLGLELGSRQFAIFDARGRELISRGLTENTVDIDASATGEPVEPLREHALALVEAARLGALPVSPPPTASFAAARIEARDGALVGIAIERDASPPAVPALSSVLLELPTTAAVIAAALLLLFLLLRYTRRLSSRLLALIEDIGADRDADDEIGELSRRLSDLVERDRAQRGYLEQLPRILGHETLGPLGVVKMAIEELPEKDAHRESARRAIHSIEDLVEDLREATSLEDALRRGERIHIDLADFLREYAAAYCEASGMRLELDLPDTNPRVQVIERRLEQLLDKLLDNAADFSGDGPVSLGLETDSDAFRIRVENAGSQLPENASADQLFAPMSSWRKRTAQRHLGLGLYVARLIAEQHGGSIRAWNADAERVVFEVTLPRNQNSDR